MTLTGASARPGTGHASGSMRAAVLNAFGDPDALRIAHVARPSRIGAEVLVQVVAAGVHPIDTATRAGRGHAAGLTSWPAVLGTDFSGVVLESPYDAFGLRPGDEVYGLTAAPRTGGSHAEVVAVPCTHLTRKPDVLSHVEAAAVPLAALTAWGVVAEQAKAHDGQRLLVHAADVTTDLAVQIAAYFGAHVVAIGEADALERLRALGAAEVVDRAARRFEDVVGEVDAVLDPFGEERGTGPRSLRTLRPGGLLVALPGAEWPSLAADARAAGVRGTRYFAAGDGATLAVVSRLITSGDLRVAAPTELPLERIADAHRLAEQAGGAPVVVRVTER